MDEVMVIISEYIKRDAKKMHKVYINSLFLSEVFYMYLLKSER